MSLYNKPTYIPSEFLKATKQGWTDIRNNEVIIAIGYLDELVKKKTVSKKSTQVEPAPVIVDDVEPILPEPPLEDEDTARKRIPR